MTFDAIRQAERSEIDRLGAHLAQLDPDGWIEQSYCLEWRIYQVVSHISSGARIFLGSLANWFDRGPAMGSEQMQAIWAKFNSLLPDQMLEEFQAATTDYFARLEALPAEAGLQEVAGFLGKVPAEDMLALRLQEVALHTWDVLVARDRAARIPEDVAELIVPAQMRIRGLRPSTALQGKRVRLETPDGIWRQLIDFRGERPVIEESGSGDSDIQVEAPLEEMCRLLGGRHFLPGSLPQLTWGGGSYAEVTALNVFAS